MFCSNPGNYGGIPTYVGWRNGEWENQTAVLEDTQQRRAARDLALANIGRCVVGDMADDAGSTLLIQHFFRFG